MQVLLLLKSSDRVAHDICHAFDGCKAPPSGPVQHALALRKWVALRPERELRCFVRQRELIGGHSACTAALRPAVKAGGCDCIKPMPASTSPIGLLYESHIALSRLCVSHCNSWPSPCSHGWMCHQTTCIITFL